MNGQAQFKPFGMLLSLKVNDSKQPSTIGTGNFKEAI